MKTSNMNYKEEINKEFQEILNWFPQDSPEARELYNILMDRWRDKIIEDYNNSQPKPPIDYCKAKKIAYQELIDIQNKIDDLDKNGKTPRWLRNIILKQTRDLYLEPALREYKKLKFLCNKQQGKVGNNYIDADIIIKEVKIDSLLSKPEYSSRQRNKYLCPLHNEDTPSFTWYKDTNSFYCFGCHEGGNVITLYMKQNKCDFKTAIKELSLML